MSNLVTFAVLLEKVQKSNFSETIVACDPKDRYSTALKRGSVFIGLITPDGAIWSRYQRAVLMR